jgi:ABC-2 type transport system permease protein
MQQFFLVLRYKTKSSLHSILEGKKAGTMKNISSLIVYASFTISAFYFSHFITHYLLDVWKIGLYLFHQFLSMVLFVFFMTISLGNMIVSYATLYRSPEVGFLMTQPITHRKVFLLKFFDNFFYSSSTLILISCAVLGGYGSYFGYELPMYVLLMVAVLFPLMLMAACIGVLLLVMLLLLTRYVSPRKLIVVVIGIYLMCVYIYFRLNSPFDLVNEVLKYYPNIDQYFFQFHGPSSLFLPNQWVGEIFYYSAYGSLSNAVPFLLLLGGCTAVITIGMFLIAKEYYYRSWILALELRTHSPGRIARLITFFSFRSRSLWRPQTEVMLKKECWTFLRDPSQWLHLAILCFLTLVFIFGVSGARYRAGNPVLQTVSYMTIYLFNGFLLSSMALRFLFPSISLEDGMLWALRSSPLRMNTVLRVKFWVGLVCVVALAIPLSYLSTYPWRFFPPLIWYAVGSAVILSAGFVSLNLGMGGTFADFREKNPVRIASSRGASLSFLLSLGYLAIVVVIAIVPIQQYYFYILLGAPPSPAGLTVGAGIVTAFTLIVMGITLRMARSALRRDV